MTEAAVLPSDGRATDPDASDYYTNRPLMWRNVRAIVMGNVGASICFTMVAPLMQLRIVSAGLKEGAWAAINSANAWAVSFLVMYFSWKSDHMVSRWGRRMPFVFLATPFIAVSIGLFPFFHNKYVLVGLVLVELLFMDMRNSTYPLLSIDCIPRAFLGRVNSYSVILLSIVGFLSLRYGLRLVHVGESVPYLLGVGALLGTTLLAGLMIREPPIHNPTSERFKPWSAMSVAWKDRRSAVLMAGVAMINSLMIVYATWLWLFAVNKLHMERSNVANVLSWGILLGALIAYPIGWLIDWWGNFRVVVLMWLMQIAIFFILVHVSTANGLMIASLFAACTNPLYPAADIMIYKSSPRAEIGSVTSTNAFVRCAYTGCLILVSGYVIQLSGGGYRTAFLLGIILSTVGMGFFVVYRQLMARCVLVVEVKTLSEEVDIGDVTRAVTGELGELLGAGE